MAERDGVNYYIDERFRQYDHVLVADLWNMICKYSGPIFELSDSEFGRIHFCSSRNSYYDFITVDFEALGSYMRETITEFVNSFEQTNDPEYYFDDKFPSISFVDHDDQIYDLFVKNSYKHCGGRDSEKMNCRDFAEEETDEWFWDYVDKYYPFSKLTQYMNSF